MQCKIMNYEHQETLEYIRNKIKDIRAKFHGPVRENVRNDILELAPVARRLFGELVSAGMEIEFSKTMIENRESLPSDPSFFQHLHAIEDLVNIIDLKIRE